MKHTGIGFLLVLIVITMLVSCATNTSDEAANETNSSLPALGGIAETEFQEVNNVKREFCKVEKLQEDNFTLRNTANELYYIDNSLLGNFKVGDNVLLLYYNRTSVGDGEYSAQVYAIYPDSDTLVRPAN